VPSVEHSLRQHRFSFLTGAAGTALPVDAYYPALKLVIEYHEWQHTDAVDSEIKSQPSAVSPVRNNAGSLTSAAAPFAGKWY
jgi:hypothetical protein